VESKVEKITRESPRKTRTDRENYGRIESGKPEYSKSLHSNKPKGGCMTEKHQVYKCESCGNIVEVLHAGEGELVCCGQPMKLTVKNTVDVAK